MFSSLKEQFTKNLNLGYTVIPLEFEFLADLETPVSAYLKLREHTDKPLFLMESVEGGEKLGRYSTIGFNPAAQIKVQNDKCELNVFWDNLNLSINNKAENNPFIILNEVLEKYKAPANSFAGLVGALSYDTVRFLEPVQIKENAELPNTCFLLTGDLVVFDHIKKCLKLITNIYISNETNEEELNKLYKAGKERLHNLYTILSADLPFVKNKIINTDSLKGLENIYNWNSNFTEEDFVKTVERAKDKIKAGDIFQIVLSQKLVKNIDKSNKLDSLFIYRLLRSLNPSPYLFLFNFGDFQLIGSSPEVMVKCELKENQEKIAVLRPIAGTYRRGNSDTEDQELMNKLKKDEKEVAEHLMLIDLARNDLGRVAKAGSVEMTDYMIVEKYSHVLHLVSEVICKLKDDMNSIDLLKAVFPAGTLTGAPKVKAMQILSQLEPDSRGFYGGCVGYIGFDGSLNTAMTIRTVLLHNDNLILQAGAGIVYDSEPKKEYQETLNKGAALLKVIEGVLQNE